MTIYHMGCEATSLTPSDATSYESAATESGRATFDSSFARCAMRAGQGVNQYAFTPPLSLPDAFYTHINAFQSGTSSVVGKLVSYYASGVEVFQLTTGAYTVQMKARIAGVLTNIGSAVAVDFNNVGQVFDLYIDGNNASGTAKLYVSGTLRETVSSVDLSAVAGIDEIRYQGLQASGTYPHFISQGVTSDEPTIGWRLLTRYPSGAGASSDFTGTYTEIDELRYSDSDFINSSTNGHVSTFAQTGPAITGYTVRAVGVYARAKKGASGPSNLQLALRSGGTTYFSGSKALDVGYAAYGHIWETNPATSADWQASAIDALQPGVKAVT